MRVIVLSSGQSVLNTDVRRELDHFAIFLQAAVNHKEKIGVQLPLLSDHPRLDAICALTLLVIAFA